MRIHEVLDACVEYVASEGILGSDVLSVQRYLTKRDSSLDASSFAYLYTLLCQHPSIQIAISTYPLPSADQSVQVGSAPLPDDYTPPDKSPAVDMGEMYRQGMRGRELAFHFAGEEHKTSKEAVAVKRAEQERGRLKRLRMAEGGEGEAKWKGKGKGKMEQILSEEGAVLFTILEEDDSALGGVEAVEKLDLAGLAGKWGNRLRIRCTDDEIYFRLTGSHQKIPKLTLPVMHALQLAARAREKGITAIELGPMIGASQGSTFYYIKVLVDLGLCAKVPAVIHGSTTNLLIFHPFLELNDNYRAIRNMGPVPEPAARVEAVEVEDDHDPSIDDTGGTGETGFNFRPMNEAEFMIGILVKERLIQLLDHPALQNHLLKARNLHALIGFSGTTTLRYARAMPRHIKALEEQGVVERLVVGSKRIECLRLTKYNPDYTGPPVSVKVAPVESVDSTEVVSYCPKDFTEAFNQHGGIAINRSLERSIIDTIAGSGKAGVTYSQIREAMTGVYKRSLEFFLIRAEDSWYPLALRGTAICSVMESFSKERRLRVFVVPAYREFIIDNRQTPDDEKHPPLTNEAGRWASLEMRVFAADVSDFWRRAQRIADGRESSGGVHNPRLDAVTGGRRTKERKDTGTKRPRTSSGKVVASKKRARGTEEAEGSDGSSHGAGKRPMLYENAAQTRGRPRKYIHVVNEEGIVKRMIIGQVLPDPSIPPVLIWVASVKKLVPAPEAYSGIGKPPPVTTEQLALGHPPSYYDRFPKVYNKSMREKAAKQGAKGRKKQKLKRGNDEDELEDSVEEPVVKDEEEIEAVPKRKGRVSVTGEKRSTRRAAAQAPFAEVNTGAPETQLATRAGPPIDPSLIDPASLLDSPNAEPPIDPALADPPLADPPIDSSLLDRPSPGGHTVPGPPAPATEVESSASGAPYVDFELPVEIFNPATELQPAKTARKRADNPVELADRLALGSASGDHAAAKPRKRSKKATPIEPIPSPLASTPAASPAPPTPTRSLTHQTGRKIPANRIDFALIRRNNELVEALKANGGVLSDARFLAAHREWVLKVAGTDAPGAPGVAYKMDRRIFKHSIPILEAEGRLRSTVCSIPTTTGRWIQQQVLWLYETPKDVVDAYISGLAEMTINSQLLSIQKGKRTQIEDQAFSVVKVAGAQQAGTKATVIKHAMRDSDPATIRRNALLGQAGVAAQLLGYISGRFARVRQLFEGIIGALGEESPSRISPSVFVLPLLFEDIQVGTFFECIHTTTYDEELHEWLSIPGNRATRLRDVPEEFRPPGGGFAGHACESKFRTILTTLCQLGLMTPLNPTPPDSADLVIQTSTGLAHFKIPETTGMATHFVVHHHAPVYHIASTNPGLLGIVPVSTPEERQTFWSTVESACTVADVNALDQLSCDTPIGLPETARINERLEIDPESLRMMRSRVRWRNSFNIHDEQRAGIDQMIDWRKGVPKISSDEDIKALAYANALRVAYVREELVRRASLARERVLRVAQKEAENSKALQAARKKNQQSLREKLAEVRLTAKKEWEERIEKAAAATGVQYTADVVSFVTHHTLTIPDRTKVGDAVIENAVRLSARAQTTRAVTGEKVQQTKNMWDRQATIAGNLRRRHVWTPFEDDLLLDAEAIIRARSRGRTRGRAAISQIFPDVGHQTLLSRFKKITGRPGKQQYYDRLEQAWYDTWIANRGVDLIDDDPDDTTGFDLKHHIEYLRAHIRKHDLRLGIQQTANLVKVPDLPVDHSQVLQRQSWRYAKCTHKTMYSITEKEVSDESKLAGYLLLPLRDEPRDIEIPSLDRRRGIVRACLKMIVSTSNETYTQAAATAFLAPFTNDQRSDGITSLVEDRVVVKQHTAAHTSRHYAYTSVWNTLTDGPTNPELYAEAQGMQERLERDKEIKWSSVCNGGDVAALLELISEGTVDFDFDVSEFRPVRYLRNTYNTRAIDDDAFEFDLTIKQIAPRPAASVALLPVPQLGPSSAPWPTSPVDVHLAVTHVLDLVHSAGANGVTRSSLQQQTNHSIQTLYAVFASLAADSPLEAFWAGYDTARLVSAEHWDTWLHTTRPRARSNVIRVRPRRWTDIYGEMIKEDWERCLRGVAGHISTRPGMILADLRSKVDVAMDRMELNEVLQYLEYAGAIRRAWVDGEEGPVPPVEVLSAEEEARLAFWSIRPWSLG